MVCGCGWGMVHVGFGWWGYVWWCVMRDAWGSDASCDVWCLVCVCVCMCVCGCVYSRCDNSMCIYTCTHTAWMLATPKQNRFRLTMIETQNNSKGNNTKPRHTATTHESQTNTNTHQHASPVNPRHNHTKLEGNLEQNINLTTVPNQSKTMENTQKRKRHQECTHLLTRAQSHLPQHLSDDMQKHKKHVTLQITKPLKT